MFVCTDCGHIFLEAKHYTETHGLERGPYETWFGCPECGGPFATAHKCEECDKWITGEYIKTSSGQRICENCYSTYELGEEDY